MNLVLLIKNELLALELYTASIITHTNVPQGSDTLQAIFTGSASQYFIIWLTNTIFNILSFGYYLPWAYQRSKKYCYENTNIAGESLSYTAGSHTLKKTWIFILSIFYLCLFLLGVNYLAVILAVFTVILMPYIVYLFSNHNVSSIHYEQNRIVSSCRVWVYYKYYVFAIISSLAIIIVSFLANVLFLEKYSYISIIVNTVTPSIIYCVFFTAYISSKLYFVNSLSCGNTAFNVELISKHTFKKALKISVSAAMLYTVLYALFVIIIYFQVLQPLVANGSSPAARTGIGAFLLIFMAIPSLLALSFLFICLSVLILYVMHIYLLSKINSDIFNALGLGEIRFSFACQFTKRLKILLKNIFLLLVTLGLYYPWARINVVRFNTQRLSIIKVNNNQT